MVRGEGRENNRFSSFLPLCAIVRLTSQGCESQPQANALRPETESNCDIVICGGEQQEVNRQSVR